MIRLTDEEIREAKVGHVAILVDGKPKVWEADRFVAKAQLKKVYEWRNEECLEHNHTINISGVDHKMIVMHNNCDKCWQALLEEVKDV